MPLTFVYSAFLWILRLYKHTAQDCLGNNFIHKRANLVLIISKIREMDSTEIKHGFNKVYPIEQAKSSIQ